MGSASIRPSPPGRPQTGWQRPATCPSTGGRSCGRSSPPSSGGGTPAALSPPVLSRSAPGPRAPGRLALGLLALGLVALGLLARSLLAGRLLARRLLARRLLALGLLALGLLPAGLRWPPRHSSAPLRNRSERHPGRSPSISNTTFRLPRWTGWSRGRCDPRGGGTELHLVRGGRRAHQHLVQDGDRRIDRGLLDRGRASRRFATSSPLTPATGSQKGAGTRRYSGAAALTDLYLLAGLVKAPTETLFHPIPQRGVRLGCVLLHTLGGPGTGLAEDE